MAVSSDIRLVSLLDQIDGVAPLDGAAEIQRLYRERYTLQAKRCPHAPTIGHRFALKYKDLIVE